MSVAPSTPTELARTTLGTTIQRSVALLVTAVRASAFWTAALLPLSYPALLATGVAADHSIGFVALFVVNAVALVLGHEHRR